MTVPATPLPTGIDDPTNARILAVSEDRLAGFHSRPFAEIAKRSGVELPVVLERIRAMLDAGTIRRVRQTLLATNLANGALVAWAVPPDRLEAAFETMARDDPFSGHVVLRSTDREITGSHYRLWTTVKVPQGYSLHAHCSALSGRVGATAFRIMPARRIFALGVGHVRRKTVEPGERASVPAEPTVVRPVHLTDEEWLVLTALKRELEPDEVALGLWERRATAAGIGFDRFLDVAHGLEARGVIGRFSTFLEHVKPLADGTRVTRYNALFHWAVPAGQELAAGCEVGRHYIVTHAYWREGGPAFGNVNVMAVVHGTEKDTVLAHKAAIDAHLREAGIDVGYTAVFWGGRSEIKPSEISPLEYRAWCSANAIDDGAMLADRNPPAMSWDRDAPA